MDSRMECRICGNLEKNEKITAKEMMFGTQEEFDYFKCSICGCLQITAIPQDMARHYPADYYSFASRVKSGLQPTWKAGIKSWWMRWNLKKKSLLRLLPFVPLPEYLKPWLLPTGINQDSRILEVGCGQGRLLRRMAAWGFLKLTGVDPFVASDLNFPDGVQIWRKSLGEMTGSFDFIMIHHAYEHMPDPHLTLREAMHLLAPGGRILICIPVSSCEAWRQYRENWVQLDAPRHFYLHSHQSLEMTANKAGCVVDYTVYDSSGFQFWGSEQYLKNTPLFSSKSYAVDRAASAFTASQIRGFDRRARRLNQKNDGDQACFILSRSEGH